MKAQNKINRIINIVFSFIMLAALVIGLACALRGKIEVNEYENRYAEKFKAFTIAAYLNSDFQDNVETALADQLPFAIDTKQRYNSLLASYSDRVLKLAGGASTYDLAEDETSSAEEEARLAAEMAAAEGERLEALKQRKAEQARGIRKDVELDPNFKYIRSASGMAVAGDHLLYPCRFLAGEQSKLDRRIENINHVIETYPGPEYYIYYVEKETDVDFETGERSGIYEYLSEGVDLPSEHKACYMLDRFSQLHSYYYHSDHHWNYRGSYAAYKSILTWLLPDEEPLVPVTSWDVGTFTGSKATGSFSNYQDTMTVYEFEYPEMEYRLDGAKCADYGNQKRYIESAKEGTMLSGTKYGATYGGDNGEIVIDNPSGNGECILVFGESYDNALVKLLASHFSTFVDIDLRNYEAKNGKSFNYQSYLDQYAPDKVLFIGNLDYYVLSTFNIK